MPFGFITVRNARTLQPVANLPLPADAPAALSDIRTGSIAIAPDDRLVYYVYWDTGGAGQPAGAYLQRWELPTGRVLPALRIGSGPLLAMRLTDAGSRLLIVSTRSVTFVDTRSSRVIHSVALRPRPTAPTVAAVSPDGRSAVIGSRTGSASFVDTATGTMRRLGQSHGAAVVGALYPSDGGTAVTIGDDDTVVVWNARATRREQVLTGPRGQVADAAISPDGSTLYTSSPDGILLVWDLAGNRRFVGQSPLGVEPSVLRSARAGHAPVGGLPRWAAVCDPPFSLDGRSVLDLDPAAPGIAEREVENPADHSARLVTRS